MNLLGTAPVEKSQLLSDLETDGIMSYSMKARKRLQTWLQAQHTSAAATMKLHAAARTDAVVALSRGTTCSADFSTARRCSCWQRTTRARQSNACHTTPSSSDFNAWENAHGLHSFHFRTSGKDECKEPLKDVLKGRGSPPPSTASRMNQVSASQ